MTPICKDPKRAVLVGRLRRVLGLSLLLSVPTFVINLLVQGRREFKAELADWKKYRGIIRKMK